MGAALRCSVLAVAVAVDSMEKKEGQAAGRGSGDDGVPAAVPHLVRECAKKRGKRDQLDLEEGPSGRDKDGRRRGTTSRRVARATRPIFQEISRLNLNISYFKTC
jgi:hypothetical protein